MKSFFGLFKDSAKSLTDIRTLATSGMLVGLSIVISYLLKIQVTADLRITFAFIPICIIAMLYGPVVCCISNFALDLILFLIDNRTPNGYSPQLALVVLLAGIIYGVFLYREKISLILIAAARITVVIVCNLSLNSYIIYSLYVNKDFNVFEADKAGWNVFILWMNTSFRFIKNVGQLPLDIIMLCIILPVALRVYGKIKMSSGYSRKRAVNNK